MKLAATFDLETSGLEGAWGRLLVASIKPYDSDTITTFTARKARERSNDYDIVSETVDELRKYAILIAHNGKRFDIPFLNARALAHGLPLMPPTTKIIDPCTIGWKQLPGLRKSLDALAQHLKLEEGKMHVGPEVWVTAALDGNHASFDILEERCESDVRVLEKVAEAFAPLMRNVDAFGSG